MKLALLALALIFVATGLGPAEAKSEKVNVTVKVRVPRACRVHPPAAMLRPGAGGLPVVAVGSFLSDCTDNSIPARLTIVRDPADNRTDVATINF